jgi:hypothetical protein
MKRLYLVLLALAPAVTIINFMVFIAVASRIGGDAVNGKEENGHYFLANHGHLTEVTAGVFTYSLWHVRSLFLTFPLGMLAMALLAMRVMKYFRV